jgi:hypothetical protein
MKKLIAKKQITENQVEMDRIAIEMATYFERRVTDRELIRWITTVHSDEKIEEYGEITDFVSNMGWDFIPNLINFKTKSSRIHFLKTALINLFRFGGYANSKKALSAIGISYLSSFETLETTPEILFEFMNVYTTFLCLAEMYSDYGYHRNEQLQKK